MRHLIIEYKVNCMFDQKFIDQAELFECDIEHATSCQQVVELVAASEVRPVVVIHEQEQKYNCFQLMTHLRKSNQAFVIFICEDFSPDTRTRLMSIGANYIIPEPFNYEELLHAVVFLFELRSPYLLIDEDLELDYKNWIIGYKGKYIAVTPKVFKTLDYLIDNKGNVKTRADISQHVSGYALETNERIVDTYIKKIRAITEYDLIVTVRNQGYMYVGTPSVCNK